VTEPDQGDLGSPYVAISLLKCVEDGARVAPRFARLSGLDGALLAP
jgi:hypothetical protein